jgi:hypothetical protein
MKSDQPVKVNFNPLLLSVCFKEGNQEFQDQEQEVDKVILNTTNLRYIILSLNTIHCSQFPTKTKTKHASLRCTIHLLYIYIGQVGARCIFVPGFWILASRGSCSHFPSLRQCAYCTPHKPVKTGGAGGAGRCVCCPLSSFAVPDPSC